MSSSNSSERRYSFTLSEDDLRPHMRKPKPKTTEVRPNGGEIEALQMKFEKREEVRKEVKRRVEEEEKAREARERDEQVRKEVEQLWKDAKRPDGNNRNAAEPLGLPRLGRRFNNSQYFKWDSVDEIPVIPEEFVPRPASRRDFSPAPSSSGTCELCTLARRAIDKSGAPTKSAACAHVDAFIADRHRTHF